MSSNPISRKDFLRSAAGTALVAALPNLALPHSQSNTDEITIDDLKAAQRLLGISFTDEQLRAVFNAVADARNRYAAVRAMQIDYTVEPPTIFTPTGKKFGAEKGVQIRHASAVSDEVPANEEELCFSSLRRLGRLLRKRKMSSVELTTTYLNRLEKYGESLLCVVTLTKEHALLQAKRADEELSRGLDRGPLHGIPYGIKDLFATKGIPTTWGAEPYKDQVFDYDSAVVERLNAAGAVMLAKLSLGALAQGDVWFRGRTKNPWNPTQGSSGSSAGSACSAAAGLAAFTIGTETLGSIVSPSHVCRVTGLRPTYGRISRYGGMAVSWTMDKVGPICRSAEDCAIVFSQIVGRDERDGSTSDRGFRYDEQIDFGRLNVCMLVQDREGAERFDQHEAVKALREMGARLRPVIITPAPPGATSLLGVEAAAAFDDFTLSDRIQNLRNSAWPNTYRSNRFVGAVEYLQAQRVRTRLMRQFEAELGDFDMMIAEERGGHTLFITNLTGHPQVLIPCGQDERGAARSVSLIGRLYDEERLLAAAWAIQKRLGKHLLRPDLSKIAGS